MMPAPIVWRMLCAFVRTPYVGVIWYHRASYRRQGGGFMVTQFLWDGAPSRLRDLRKLGRIWRTDVR